MKQTTHTHRWQTRKTNPVLGRYCSTCQASELTVGTDSACLAARHSDPELDGLFRARRKAAEAADGSGVKASRGWAELDSLGQKLMELDPDGDWFYEGNHHDGRGWVVSRPEKEALHTEAFAAFQAARDAKALSRGQATRVSIGNVRPGQDIYVLRSGRLKHQGTVLEVPARQGGSAGFTLKLEKDGKEVSTWGGSATQFYVATEATHINGAEPQKGDAKAMASKTTSTESKTSKPEATQVDLHKALQTQLKEAGLKVTVQWSPSKKYAAYKVDGQTLAYVFTQTATGIKVKARVELKELGKDKKAWLDSSKEAPFSARGFFTEANLAMAVTALSLAAEKLATAKTAKAEAKKAQAKKPAAKAPAKAKPASKAKARPAAKKETAPPTAAGSLETAPTKPMVLTLTPTEDGHIKAGLENV
jgi:hypothetical protein